MERYVWELTRELAALGHRVGVLCEEVCVPEVPPGIELFPLGTACRRPRWIGYLLFSRRVHGWVEKQPPGRWMIHSHERTGDHHVTTFHGPPFAHVRTRPLWKRASPRVAAYLWMERREVCGPTVRVVVPNSRIIGAQLRTFYPDASRRVASPIVPGVAQASVRAFRPVPENAGIVGFVGVEWRRKGLELAVRIVRELGRTRPGMEFRVAGPRPEEIRHLFRGFEGAYRLLGKADAAELYPKLDLLLHPALNEPYGMVVAEAMAANVGVVVSDRCGVTENIGERHGSVLSLEDPLEDWVRACREVLSRTDSPPGYRRSWGQVAREYEELYRSLAGEGA